MNYKKIPVVPLLTLRDACGPPYACDQNFSKHVDERKVFREFPESFECVPGALLEFLENFLWLPLCRL
jgi:hypothetical protein